MKDVQNWPDTRGLAIQKTGVKGVKHPIRFKDTDTNGTQTVQSCAATFDMYVGLDEAIKGTHMSRFLQILHDETPFTLSLSKLPTLTDTILTRLDALSAHISVSFDYFLSKTAPISKINSFLDYKVTITSQIVNHHVEHYLSLDVPVTTLCPCSKAISAFGAHNQRSNIISTIRLPRLDVSIQALIRVIEQQGSCELYGIIKRQDEKQVTEQAYENPKFVEDVVRDVALVLEQQGFHHYRVSSENLESIHNHSAFACIDKL